MVLLENYVFRFKPECVLLFQLLRRRLKRLNFLLFVFHAFRFLLILFFFIGLLPRVIRAR